MISVMGEEAGNGGVVIISSAHVSMSRKADLTTFLPRPVP
jgi:hypothetical protein